MTSTAMNVVLRSVPVKLFVDLQQHIDELVRELQVIEGGEDRPIPAELRDVIARILSDYASARADSWEQAAQAQSNGEERADIVINLPPEAADAAVEFGSLLDRADALCRSGILLTLPEGGDLKAFRSWTLSQTVAQLRDGVPGDECPI